MPQQPVVPPDIDWMCYMLLKWLYSYIISAIINITPSQSTGDIKGEPTDASDTMCFEWIISGFRRTRDPFEHRLSIVCG